MRFAIRGREVIVPSLVGKTEDEAMQLFRTTGLLLRVSEQTVQPDIPEGQILEQNPPNGTRLKDERSVKVLAVAW